MKPRLIFVSILLGSSQFVVYSNKSTCPDGSIPGLVETLQPNVVREASVFVYQIPSTLWRLLVRRLVVQIEWEWTELSDHPQP